MSATPFQDLDQRPMDRFVVVQQPGALPGCCMFCKGIPSEERIWFVDTALQEDFVGALYICNLCLYAMAHIAGWITPEQARSLQEDVQGLLGENFHLKTQIASLHTLEQAVDSFVYSRNSAHNDARNPDSIVAPLHLLQQGDEPDGPSSGGESHPSGPATKLGEGTGTLDEQGDDKGVDHLRPNESGPSGFNLSF